MAEPFDYLRTSWIAFFTLWTLWGFVYFIRHAFDMSDVSNKPAPSPVPPTTDDPESTPANKEEEDFWKLIRPSIPYRLERSHQVLFENSLMLLSVLCLYTFGNTGSRAVMILSWIFFAFTVLHAFTEVAITHHIIRLVFSLIFYGVTLAIGGIAFKQGWS